MHWRRISFMLFFSKAFKKCWRPNRLWQKVVGTNIFTHVSHIGQLNISLNNNINFNNNSVAHTDLCCNTALLFSIDKRSSWSLRKTSNASCWLTDNSSTEREKCIVVKVKRMFSTKIIQAWYLMRSCQHIYHYI